MTDNENKEGVKTEEKTSDGKPTEEKNPDDEGKKPVENSGENTSKTVDELLGKEGKRSVDAKRFNELNEKAKLADTFGPVIDKLKDNPDLVKKILETEEKGSLESRMDAFEEREKDVKRNELRTAMTEALSIWPKLKDEWSEISDQVEMLRKRGVFAGDAIRRSYLALHPEEAQAEATRIAQQSANETGQVPHTPGAPPKPIDTTPSTELNEREKLVAKDLMGKDINGWVPFKSEADYAAALRRNEASLKTKGFYDLP